MGVLAARGFGVDKKIRAAIKKLTVAFPSCKASIYDIGGKNLFPLWATAIAKHILIIALYNNCNRIQNWNTKFSGGNVLSGIHLPMILHLILSSYLAYMGSIPE